jgi:hypothetical protein
MTDRADSPERSQHCEAGASGLHFSKEDLEAPEEDADLNGTGNVIFLIITLRKAKI